MRTGCEGAGFQALSARFTHSPQQVERNRIKGVTAGPLISFVSPMNSPPNSSIAEARSAPPHDFSLGEVAVALSPLQRFEEFLQSKGKRITQPRKALVEFVFSGHEHFDADELTAKLSGRDGRKKVSRPTVYRTLNELVDAGLLRKLDLNGRAVYEHDYGYPSHDHLHCEKCDRLIEFHSEELERIRDEVARSHRFRVKGHRMIVEGICEECSRTRKRAMRPQDLV